MTRITWRRRAVLGAAAMGLSLAAPLTSSFTALQVSAAQTGAPTGTTTGAGADQTSSVEAAAKVLDLRTLPLAAGAVVPDNRVVGGLTYQVPGGSKAAFQFHQQQLLKLGWKELLGATSEDAYGSGMYTKSGYTISLSTSRYGSPDQPEMAYVSIHNFGNVPLTKLPKMKGLSAVYESEISAIYTTSASVAEAAEQSRKALLDAEWESYGVNDVSDEQKHFTVMRNAVQVSVMVNLAPAQGNKTSVMYSSAQLSADIPAPVAAKQVSYIDSQKTLRFYWTDDFATLGNYYQQALAKRGWKSTTDELVISKDDFDRPAALMVFRNAAKEMITLDIQPAGEQREVSLVHLTEAEMRAQESRQKAAAEKEIAAQQVRQKESDLAAADMKKRSAKMEKEFDSLADSLIAEALGSAGGQKSKSRPATKDKAAPESEKSTPLPLPAEAKASQTSDNVLQVKVGKGKGKQVAEYILKNLQAAGWESEDEVSLEKISGNFTVSKDTKRITANYVDTGFTDVMLMVIGFGTDLQVGEGTELPAAKNAVTKSGTETNDTPPTGQSAKQMAQDLLAKKQKQSADEPVRVEKPKQGIARMPRLPSAGSVSMGDKTFALTEVIAYEMISNGEWITKIVATAKPVKQEKLLALLKKAGNDEDMEFPEPNLRISINGEDIPVGVSFVADGVQVGGGRDTLGELLVEDGRARGTLKLEEPGEFFERSFTWEISFDTNVLTRDSEPAKRELNLPKLANDGQLQIGDATTKLKHVVAYEVNVFDEKRIAVLITEKPVDLKKLKSSLQKDGTDSDFIDFQSQVKLEFDDNDAVKQLNLYSDGFSMSSNSDLESDAVIVNGRIRGTAKLTKPGESFGKKFTFSVSFDTEIIPLPTAK